VLAYCVAGKTAIPLQYILSNTVFFSLGIALSQERSPLILSARWLGVLAVSAVAGQMIFHGLLGLHYQDYGLPSLLLAVVCAGTVIALSWSINETDAGRWLAWLGRKSMYIYLMHILCAAGFRILAEKLFHQHNPLLHLVGGVCAGIFIPIMLIYSIRHLRLMVLFAPPRRLSFNYWTRKLALPG